MEYTQYSCIQAEKRPAQCSHNYMLAWRQWQRNTNTIFAGKTTRIKSFDPFIILVKLPADFWGHMILRYCLFFSPISSQKGIQGPGEHYCSFVTLTEGCRNSLRCSGTMSPRCARGVGLVHAASSYCTSFPVHICPFIYTKHIKQNSSSRCKNKSSKEKKRNRKK